MKVQVINVNIPSYKIGELAAISHGEQLKRSPVSLTKNLWEWGHLTPFEFQVWLFRIKAPIYVARQLMRYRTGAFIEKSLRYTEASEFFFPRLDLYGPKVVEHGQEIVSIIDHTYDQIARAYFQLLEIAPKELARIILPLGVNTEFYWKIDSRNLYHVLEQRLSKHAQPEIRHLAKLILEAIKEHDLLLYELYNESLGGEGE